MEWTVNEFFFSEFRNNSGKRSGTEDGMWVNINSVVIYRSYFNQVRLNLTSVLSYRSYSTQVWFSLTSVLISILLCSGLVQSYFSTHLSILLYSGMVQSYFSTHLSILFYSGMVESYFSTHPSNIIEIAIMFRLLVEMFFANNVELVATYARHPLIYQYQRRG